MTCMAVRRAKTVTQTPSFAVSGITKGNQTGNCPRAQQSHQNYYTSVHTK